MINELIENYNIIEFQSLETEKAVNIYLHHFIEKTNKQVIYILFYNISKFYLKKKKKIKFNCTDLHRRIFVFFVYNDPLIRNFIETITNFFSEKNFETNKYNNAI